ncbi:OmpA family protein [Legionella sp. km772]|uniref:OmpA family protein n=1 Tax=Legionella sp. km772 TaxID=2498111 RepID=UPI000F8C7260|nr:OmpA family protein [Legionella sp. km772]RUR08342.1 flagellar motor protein MotD [Legionella sp. km772]
MTSKRSKNHDEHTDTHRWVISYADFITLLFAFFVVMYAISSVNVSKYKSLSEGMKSAFNKKDQNQATQSTAEIKNGPEAKKTKGTFQDGLDYLKKSLSELEDGSYKVNSQEDWIEVDIKAGSLFQSGTADLTPQALLKLMQLAGKIKDLPYTIVVEGYTDSIPIETPQYPSNWELSAARAASVGRALNSFGVNSQHILVTGYGEQYPIADNSTEDGRSANRRVNIIIVKDKSVSRMFNPQVDQLQS